MKKFFKLFGVALVAGAMFTACGDDPVTPEGGDTTGGNTPEPPAVVEGINVTFGEETWAAAADAETMLIDDPQMGKYAYIFAGKVAGGAEFPLVNIIAAAEVGTQEATYVEANMALDNQKIIVCDYYKATALVNGNGQQFGDYWAKTATWKVDSFDATSMELNGSMEAVMFSAADAYLQGGVGYENADIQNMKVTLGKVVLTLAQ